MIERHQFIAKLRELGYSYKKDTKRGQLYRKTGGTHRVWLPSTKLLDPVYVRSTLNQIECSPEDIEAFIMS